MSTVKFNTWQNTDGTENYKCRAWVNFDGTTNTGGNCDIRGSGNVSSVTDNNTGSYTVNFSTAFTDANYAVASTTGEGGANRIATARTYTTSSVDIRVYTTAFVDNAIVCVAVFR